MNPPPAVAFFRQGRWWCEPCRVQWAGSWEVPAEAKDDWAPVHDCGRVMESSAGDERCDPIVVEEQALINAVFQRMTITREAMKFR